MRRLTVPTAYDQSNEVAWRQAVRDADDENHKRDTDIEVGRGHRLVLTDTVTGTRYALTLASGMVVLTAV